MASMARVGSPSGKRIKAVDVCSKVSFYCDNEGCSARMSIVSMGSPSAHFRSVSRADHAYAECLRNDVLYNKDIYDNKRFKYSDFKERIMHGADSSREHGHVDGKGGRVGSGSRIPPMTLKAVYAAYIDSLSDPNAPIGDSRFQDFMRCKENYADFILNPEGFFVVETTFYHKVKDETAFILNIPMFKKGEVCHHIKASFADKIDFRRVYNHYVNAKPAYLNIMLVANEWVRVEDNPDYIAECTITKSSQHTYIS